MAAATIAAIAVLPLWLAELVWMVRDGALPPEDLWLFGIFDLGVLLVAGTLLGAAQGLVVRIVRQASLLLGDWRGPSRAWEGRAYTLLAVPIAAYLAFELFQGRQAQLLPARHLIAVCTGLLLVLCWSIAIRAALRVRWVLPRMRWVWVTALAAGLLGSALALAWIDRYVLVRLYAPIHTALAAGAFVLAELAVAVVGVRRPLSGRLGFYALGFLAAGLSASFTGLGGERLRGTAVERASLGGKVLAAVPLGGPAQRPLAPDQVERSASPLPPGPRLPGRDIVLVTVDALRADRLGAWGYRRSITPNLDGLTKRSTLFTRAYCQVPHTSFSVATLLTGQYVHTRAALGLPVRVQTMSGVLRRFGYKTAGFFPPAVFFIDRERFREFEEQRYDFEYVKYQHSKARQRTDQVLAFLAKEKPQRLFIWVHYFEPHEPYVRHPDFDFGPSAPDRYDGEVAVVDREIGRLLEALDRERPGAIVAVTADHGEEFGDHGGHYHGRTLYDEQIKVPLIVRIPGLEPRRLAHPVGTVDLAPTLLALVDVPPPSTMSGTDLGPWISGADPDRLPAAYSEVFTQKMAARGRWKLVVDSESNVARLYDLEQDPRERRNLVDARRRVVGELRGEIQRRLDAIADARGRPSRETALQRGRAGDPFAADALVELLREGDSESRREAAKLLFDLAGTSVAADLKPFLEDEDPEVAHRIALVTARMGLAGSVDRARALLTRADLPPAMRRQAALALAERGSSQGLDVLLEATGPDLPFWDRRAVVMALGRLGNRRATPTLLRLIDDVRMRRLAVVALGQIGDPRAVEPLLNLLEDDPYISVREVAARALGEIGDRRATRKLRALLPRETEPPVVAAMLVTLAGFDALPRGAPTASPRWLVLRAEQPGSAQVEADGRELALIEVGAGLGAYLVEDLPAGKLVVSGATLLGSWAR